MLKGNFGLSRDVSYLKLVSAFNKEIYKNNDYMKILSDKINLCDSLLQKYSDLITHLKSNVFTKLSFIAKIFLFKLQMKKVSKIKMTFTRHVNLLQQQNESLMSALSEYKSEYKFCVNNV